MKYLVDGYNLLFNSAWARFAPSLEEARKKLIEELDFHAKTLNLTLTLVFDAPLQTDELKRGHFHSLEIIFTAKGQTADEYLIEHVNRKSHKVVVVTSDKKLAHKVKGQGAFVESVHDFLMHLRKKSQNKLAKSKKIPVAKKAVVAPKLPIKEKPIATDKLPPLSDLEAWEQIFETELQKYERKRK